MFIGAKMNVVTCMFITVISLVAAPQVSADEASGGISCDIFGNMAKMTMAARQSELEKTELDKLIASSFSEDDDLLAAASLMSTEVYKVQLFSSIDTKAYVVQVYKQKWLSICQKVKAKQAKVATPDTVTGFKDKFQNYTFDKTGKPNIIEAKNMLNFLDAELSKSSKSLVVGRFANNKAISIWTSAYGFKPCYSLRFGTNLKSKTDTSYHANNKTYFEICKKVGDSAPYFDRKQIQ